jgi:hypothetical protein
MMQQQVTAFIKGGPFGVNYISIVGNLETAAGGAGN